MRRVALLVIAVLALLPATAAAQDENLMVKRLARYMRAAGPYSGAYVFEVGGEKPHAVFRWRQRTPRILASNTKLFTTTAALARFGALGHARHRGARQRRARHRGRVQRQHLPARGWRPDVRQPQLYQEAPTAAGRPCRTSPTCSRTSGSSASPAGCTGTSPPSTRFGAAPTRATACRPGWVRSARSPTTADSSPRAGVATRRARRRSRQPASTMPSRLAASQCG